jgi:hypothetical protein
MLTEDALQNAFKRQAYSREKVGRDCVNWRKWATPFERVLRSALSCEHLITDQAEAQVLIEPILSLLGNRIVWMSSNMLGSAVSLNLCFLTKDGTLNQNRGMRIAARLFH